MATIDLGKVALVWKGTFDSATTYESKDVVQFTDSGEVSSYIYVNASGASGQTPSTGGTVNTTYWNKMAGGAAGIWASGLSLGTAGQVVKVNSGASALEFGQGSKVLGMKCKFNNATTQVSSNGSGDTRDHADICGGNVVYTPQSTTSKILVSLTSGTKGWSDQPAGGFGLSLSVSQSGGLNYTNHYASPYGGYDLNSSGSSYGWDIAISRMDSNSSTNPITVTGQGYWYDETPNGFVQYTAPCLTVFEYEE
tara:strand:- start:6232 stop:6987 length:756 start_codon:yes stop_codon:yes gene_type:complete